MQVTRSDVNLVYSLKVIEESEAVQQRGGVSLIEWLPLELRILTLFKTYVNLSLAALENIFFVEGSKDYAYLKEHPQVYRETLRELVQKKLLTFDLEDKERLRMVEGVRSRKQKRDQVDLIKEPDCKLDALLALATTDLENQEQILDQVLEAINSATKLKSQDLRLARLIDMTRSVERAIEVKGQIKDNFIKSKACIQLAKKDSKRADEFLKEAIVYAKNSPFLINNSIFLEIADCLMDIEKAFEVIAMMTNKDGAFNDTYVEAWVKLAKKIGDAKQALQKVNSMVNNETKLKILLKMAHDEAYQDCLNEILDQALNLTQSLGMFFYDKERVYFEIVQLTKDTQKILEIEKLFKQQTYDRYRVIVLAIRETEDIEEALKLKDKLDELSDELVFNTRYLQYKAFIEIAKKNSERASEFLSKALEQVNQMSGHPSYKVRAWLKVAKMKGSNEASDLLKKAFEFTMSIKFTHEDGKVKLLSDCIRELVEIDFKEALKLTDLIETLDLRSKVLLKAAKGIKDSKLANEFFYRATLLGVQNGSQAVLWQVNEALGIPGERAEA